MSPPAPDNTSHSQGDPATGDLFTKCARRITSLLCGSADVNGGRTMADWERFLRTSENSFLSGANNFQQYVAATQERLLHSQQDSENNSSLRSQEAMNTAEDSFSSRSLEQIFEDNTPVGRSPRQAVLSAASSDVNSFPTSVNSCSSAYANNYSDCAVSVDSDDSIGEVRSARPLYDISEHQGSESTESVESSSASTNIHAERKRFLNWFRNPWHLQSARGGSVPLLGMGARHVNSEGLSDSGGASNHASFFLLRPYCLSGPLLHRHVSFDEIPSDTDDTGNTEGSGMEEAMEGRSVIADQNSPDSPPGEYPDYGRGSPDGLSSGRSVGSSTQSLSSEEIVIIDDSDPEMQGILSSPNREGVLLHLEQREESRPPSALSLVSSSDDSSTPSWASDSPEEEEEAAAVPSEVSEEHILGMLPAGYHQSDDNLFGQQQELRESLMNELTQVLTEQEMQWMRTHHVVPHPLPEERDLPAGSSPYLMTTSSVISALECPVCFTYMCAPIWLCVNGHNVCGRCQQRVFSCPVCRGRLLYTRNLALEAIAGDLSFQTQKEGHEADPQKSDAKVVSANGDVHLPDVVTQPVESGDSPHPDATNARERTPNNNQEETEGGRTATSDEINRGLVDSGPEQSIAINSPQPKSPTSI